MKFPHLLLSIWAAWGICGSTSLWAQGKETSNDALEEFGLPSLPDSFSRSSEPAEKVTFSADYQLEQGSDKGRIKVTAQIAAKHHIYSTTQPDGGPMATRIRLDSKQVELTGPFVPDHAPNVSKSEYFPVKVEEFHDSVVWSAPLKVNSPIDPSKGNLAVRIDGQVCLTDGSCQLVRSQITAGFEGYYGTSAAATELRPAGTHATWSASIVPGQIEAGGKAHLIIKAIPDDGYHVYVFDPKSKSTDGRTVIVATQKAGLRFGAPRTDQEVVVNDFGSDLRFEYHPGPVQWTIPIEVPESAESGQYPVEMLVGFTTCSDTSCDSPSGIRLTGVLEVAEPSPLQTATLNVESVAWEKVAELPSFVNWIDNIASDLTVWQRLQGGGLEWWMVGAALLGGFILNFMPCVLPVIGLKLMSFVSQAGSSHSRVVSLNLAFVGGILAVLMGLAALNIAFKVTGQAFGWGEQFNRLEFQVGLTVLLFAMALSFLGVWEIPIPGFATGSKSGELMEREGLMGAFYKGALTTILATPCSGPLLGTVFGLTLSLSVWSIVALFFLVGIGLGLPYLALCLWPGFVKWLPKPGAWMETLKEVLAFPLLLTVVYFIAVISPDYRIAALTLLIAVWFGCWLIGRVPVYAERRRKVAGWVTALSVCLAIGALSFTFLGPVKHYLPWQEYSEKTLAENRANGNVVMIDFTARWCATCQLNLYAAIDRPAVAELVKQNNVVPLLADWSDKGDEIAQKLRELDSNSIPLLAIYPSDPEAEPILLRDVITQGQLIEALQMAGPSKGVTRLTSQPKYD